MSYRFFTALCACIDLVGAVVVDDAGLLQRAHGRKHSVIVDEPMPSSDCENWYNSASWDDDDRTTPTIPVFSQELAKLVKSSWDTLVSDIDYVTRTPNPCWPQDGGTYGPLLVRLAWHCSGTYRIGRRGKKQRGGCGGGRIRFSPEKDWGDNRNLDKARALLKPVKDKYGAGLSWGDLIILAGTLYMHDVGAPTHEFCFGRVDDPTNLKSLMLNNECNADGNCTEGPLHPTLIYVNPAGANDHMDPEQSVGEVAEAFTRMGFTLHETAALIGGGHAFGRAHGAETACSGQGCHTANVQTSGYHGAWTTNPTKWDNEYFKTLQSVSFVEASSPAGKPQWVPAAGSNVSGIFMTNADLAMNKGEYAKSTAMFADDVSGQVELDVAFGSAWSKLTEQGEGFLPFKRCMMLGYAYGSSGSNSGSDQGSAHGSSGSDQRSAWDYWNGWWGLR